MQAPASDKPRPFLRLTQAAAFLALGIFALHACFGLGGHGLDGFFNNWVYNGLVLASAASCLVRGVRYREHRVAWLLLGAGLTAWSAGEIYNSVFLADTEVIPPTPSDYLSLSFYPASYAALILLVRKRANEARASLWLDGVVAALAVCAVCEATVFHTVVQQAVGYEPLRAVVTDLAYPAADMLMLALVASVFALTAWRPGRAWTLIGLGLVTAAVADSIFLYQSAAGTYEVGGALDALWPTATLLIGCAAWEPVSTSGETRLEGWRILLLPGAFALSALGFLVYDHYGHVDGAAVVLAALTLVAVIARTAMTFGENMRMLQGSRQEALTDALTGLGNRRRLMLDLKTELDGAELASPVALALFDLDGFKRYNDNFGHPAGDALLARLGRNLAGAVEPPGRAYRLGGDEFCVLVPTNAAGVPPMVAGCTDALSEHGKGFHVTASHGAALLPEEAGDPSAAMRIADRRLYGNKGSRQTTAVGQQTRDVLMQVLAERQPELHEHVHEVSELALALGRRMSLTPKELDEMAQAAELHDVGKMAIPDEILNKPAPLDPVELGFIRQHTIVGERILAAAPALGSVAKLVRASHENWDGSGYPDGLAGDQIPVQARIIAACDAFHAMTSERPYKPATSREGALSEVRRCAGTHFDPAVVEILCDEITSRSARPPAAESEPQLGLDMPAMSAPEGLAAPRPLGPSA